MTEFVEHKDVWEAIEAVRNEMPKVEEDGSMSLGSNNVKFTKMKDIRRALYPLLAKHRLLRTMRVIHREVIRDVADPILRSDGLGAVGNGKVPAVRVQVLLDYELGFTHVPSGTSMSSVIAAEAMDTSSDKATGKATTAGIKRFFGELFDIIDEDEREVDGEDPEDRNRVATTDTQNRGQQAIAGARPGAVGRAPSQRSVTTNPRPGATTPAAQAAAEVPADPNTGEVSESPIEPLAAPEADRLTKAKQRVMAANKVLGLDKVAVDALATELTGKKTREEWIQLPTLVEKIAKDLEAKVAEKQAGE